MIGFAWLTAFLSGAGVLVVELAATRSLAPFFGQTLFVWTNVIGLVLLGLALGSICGGRVADRRPNPTLLAGILAAAALLVALSAYLPPVVSRWFLPEKLPLEAAYEFLLEGSFLTTLICFVPPVLLLGAVPPFLVRCSAERLERVGERSGLLYGASTLGSIAGTFLTTYLLLPNLGTRGSLLLAAGLLALSAVPLLLSVRQRGGAAAVALLAAGFSLGAAHPSQHQAIVGLAYGTLVEARDSPYQHIEVRERDDLEARVLTLDEGHDSFQSLLPRTGFLTGGYYDYYNLLAHQVARAGRLDVLILGLASGTHARQMLHFFASHPGLRIVGVELDPEVVEMAHRLMGLPEGDPRLEVVSGVDGRIYLEHCGDRFDLIIIDCYADQSYLPFHLCSREFFTKAQGALHENGILALNVYGFGAADPVVSVVSNTMAQAFAEGLVLCALQGTSNFLLYASRNALAPLPAELSDEGLPEPLQATLAALRAPYRSFRVRFDPEQALLDDDSGMLDRLQDRRLRDRARNLLLR